MLVLLEKKQTKASNNTQQVTSSAQSKQTVEQYAQNVGLYSNLSTQLINKVQRLMMINRRLPPKLFFFLNKVTANRDY